MNYPTFTLPGMLEHTAQRLPDSTALIYFGARLPYRRLLEHAERLAAGLQALGLQKGDRVALLLPNCPQFVVGFFGALRAGGVVTPTSVMYTPRELVHQWHDAGARFAIVDRRFLPNVRAALPQLPELRHIVLTGAHQYYPAALRRLEERLAAGPQSPSPEAKPARSARAVAMHEWTDMLANWRAPQPVAQTQSDLACLQYTGGTTGTSKGAMLSHGNLVINTAQTCNWIQADMNGGEVMVAALPLFHIFALTCVMCCCVMTGGTMIILPRFELKAALNVIRKYRPTMFHGVPTMYVAFNSVPDVERYGFRSLRVCVSGGAPLPVEVRQKFEARTGGKLVEGYGLTEASPVTHINPPTGSPKVGSIGQPVADTQVRIVDLETGTRDLPPGEVGEIIIRGPQVMQGYWNKPQETAQVLRDGWLYTGDIAKKDADDYYYIVDRKKDMIIAGGYNIYPREVEEVLFENPKIAEAAVIGVPDPYRGETVKAFVVLRPGATATAEEIIAFCRERLAAYKVPRIVVFRDSLPKSAVGKYLRRELRNL